MGGPKQIQQSLAQWGSKRWTQEIHILRQILLDCGLSEDIKWGKLCYSDQGKNIAILQEMKSFLALMFFKGSLLSDPKSVLSKPGENSNAGRRFEFGAAEEIIQWKETIESYVGEAIEITRAGLKVPKSPQLVFPEELLAKFNQMPTLQLAFAALTPGRQRGYAIYFSGPKGREARERRIEKYTPKILAGKGFHDR